MEILDGFKDFKISHFAAKTSEFLTAKFRELLITSSIIGPLNATILRGK